MHPTNAIELNNVTKTFGRVDAVEDASFAVPKGAVTALLGPNGAGKTTILRMILGLAEPTSGTVELRRAEGGRPLIGASLDGGWGSSGISAARDGEFCSRVLGVERRRAEEIREYVGLSALDMRKPVAKFSTGMRQRHGIGIALLADPELLVLDEPVNGLDPAGIRWLRGVMLDFAASGRTVLLSSHLLGEVATVADYLVVMNRTLRFAGSVDELDARDPQAGDLEAQYFALLDELEAVR